MRIAFLIPMMSGRGGTESALEELRKGLQSLGDEVHYYLLGGASSDPGWAESTPHTIVGDKTEARLSRFRKYSFGLAANFREFQPDAVIALDSARLLKGKIALRLALSRAPLVSWIHFPIDRIRHPKLLKIADGHLAISEGVAEQLRSFLGLEGRGGVSTIYNAVTTEHVARVPRPVGRAQFLHIGRLEFEGQKRVGDLLEAASRVTGEFELTIIGDGKDRAKLETHGESLGLGSRVRWLGWQDAPWEHVKEASALLLTSSYEGFPMILLEALTRGVPCISSDCKVGPSEILEPGKNGWLYPVGDVARLAELIQSVVDDPASLPDADAVADSAQRFSGPAVAERTHQALRSFGASTI